MFPAVEAEVTETVTANQPQIDARVLAALTNAMEDVMEGEQAVVQRKLSGEVLKVRTGRLLGSVRINPPAIEGETLTGSVEAGRDAPEGVFQEFGTHGPYVIEARVARVLA